MSSPLSSSFSPPPVPPPPKVPPPPSPRQKGKPKPSPQPKNKTPEPQPEVKILHNKSLKRPLDLTSPTHISAPEPPKKAHLEAEICGSCTPLAGIPVLAAAQLFTPHTHYRCIVGTLDEPLSSHITRRPIRALQCLDAYHWSTHATQTLKNSVFPTLLPTEDLKQENLYPRIRYGTVERLSIMFGGLWVGWVPHVPISGTLEIITTLHDPSPLSLPAPSLSFPLMRAPQTPTVEFLVGGSTVFHEKVKGISVRLINVDQGMWIFSLHTRISQHLHQIVNKIPRTDKQCPILTFQFKFTMSSESAQKAILSILPTARTHPTFETELERVTKLVSTPSAGHFSVQLIQ